MIRGRDLYRLYGDPAETQKHMISWAVPGELCRGAIPKRIYCHHALVPMLIKVFSHLITRGHLDELKTWDGCYNHRPIRGYESRYKQLTIEGNIDAAMDLLSIHSWGLAIDVNAATNGLGKDPTLSPEFVKCFTDAGFEWGGTWKRKDGMHFQIRYIPA